MSIPYLEKIKEEGKEIEDEVLKAEFNEAERAFYTSDISSVPLISNRLKLSAKPRTISVTSG